MKEPGEDWYNSETHEAKKVIMKVEKSYQKYGNDYYKTQFCTAKQAK